MEALRIARTGYCRGCCAVRRWSFAGYATQTGFENSDRPRGYYRSCTTCGLNVLTLERVEDVEGICRATIDAWLRARGTLRFPATGEPPQYRRDSRIDLGDALAFLMSEAWNLYLTYNPRPGTSFLGRASTLLQARLASFIREATGDASARRSDPKAHAVSIGLDALEHAHAPADRLFAGRSLEALRRNPGNARRHRPGDVGGLHAERDRQAARDQRATGQPASDAGAQRDPSPA